VAKVSSSSGKAEVWCGETRYARRPRQPLPRCLSLRVGCKQPNSQKLLVSGSVSAEEPARYGRQALSATGEIYSVNVRASVGSFVINQKPVPKKPKVRLRGSAAEMRVRPELFAMLPVQTRIHNAARARSANGCLRLTGSSRPKGRHHRSACLLCRFIRRR